MFLAIDIGNSTISIGYFQDRLLKGSFHVSNASSTTFRQLTEAIQKTLEQRLGQNLDISGVGVSSVVPTMTAKFLAMIEKYLKIEPKLLSYDQALGFRVLYDDPRQLGSDRLANVVAARKIYGFPSLVVDLGTAAKYEVIDKNGDYLGGLIAPGVGISAAALFEKGARLFPVDLKRPQGLIGKNTEQALQSGIYHSFLGQITYIIRRIGRQLEYNSLKVVATGGYAELFREESELFNIVDLDLTLKGLEIALNQ
jgi:type III pantothenate kinase